MNCRYCQTWNAEEEHRCQHCGRRLRLAASRPAPDSYTVAGTALATAPAFPPETLRVAPPASAAPNQPKTAYQPSLFGLKEVPRVVPMPQTGGTTPAPLPRVPSAKVHSRKAVGQQNLEFTAPAARTLKNSVEAVIYCDAPVALPAHRVMAAALDALLVLVGLGLFFGTFYAAGGEIVLNRQTLPLFLGIAVVLAIFYKFLWCLGGGDTAGMRWTHLRLVDFDGREPDREQRAFRLAGSCLSVVAAGLGLIWAIVDEESLTWHDHISKTFPTPYNPDAN